MKEAFLKEVKAKRVIKRLTQKDVADVIGISRRAYISFEHGQQKKFKNEETLFKLCDFLEVDIPTEEEKEPLKFKPKMTCEISSDSQIYKGLMLAGLVEPGDMVRIIIERA